MSLFPRIFFLVCGEYVVRFPLPVVFFYLVTTSWIFYISLLCENSINQSLNQQHGIFPHKIEGKQLIRGYTKFDFTVDEGKGRLNPSRDKNEGKHRRRKVEKSWVTFLLCDPGWCVPSLTLTRKKGMTKHRFIFEHTRPQQRVIQHVHNGSSKDGYWSRDLQFRIHINHTDSQNSHTVFSYQHRFHCSSRCQEFIPI